jgi:hypothetical protein
VEVRGGANLAQPGLRYHVACRGLRCRYSVALGFPSSAQAVFTEVNGSSPVSASLITWAASCRNPRSRREAPSLTLPGILYSADGCDARGQSCGDMSPARSLRSA